jgi:hypothetical protein
MNVADKQLIDAVVESVSKGLWEKTVADSKEQAEQWMGNSPLYWAEQLKNVTPLSTEQRAQASMACSKWLIEECEFLVTYHISRDDVFQALHNMHYLMRTDTTSSEIVMHSPQYMKSLYRHLPVKNIGWVHAFSWLLPAADEANAANYKVIGRMMVASFYMFWIEGRDYQYPKDLEGTNIEYEYLHAFGSEQ